MALGQPEPSQRGLAVGVLTLLAVAAMTATAVAVAGTAPPKHYTAADQARARSIVLKQSDIGPASVWHGGMKTPDLSPPPSCPNYHPDESDLPVTGAAESSYGNQTGLVQYDSKVQILQTAKMVQLDWQRSIQPGLLPCLRGILEAGLPATQTLVSLTRLAVPHIAALTAEYRIVFDVHRPTAPKTVRLMSDVLLIGSGRTEITLSTDALYAARGPIEQSELSLARTLVARIPATA